MKIIQCDESYADQILAIFNDAIANTTSLYEYHPRTLEVMQAWFADKRKGNYPVIGAVDEEGRLLGFGTYGVFRMRPAYKYTVEHSIYVDAAHRGHGLGKILLREVIAAAEAQNYHVLVAGVDSSNAVSIALHKKFGFNYCGTVKQAGYKFGRWLDLDFYQLILKTPAEPMDG
jgi:phosphinothricin acetyltransferase